MKRVEEIKVFECMYGVDDYGLFTQRENYGKPLEKRKVILKPETGCDVYISGLGDYLVSFEEDTSVYELRDVIFRKWGEWFVRDPKSYKRNNWKHGNDYMLVEEGLWE